MSALTWETKQFESNAHPKTREGSCFAATQDDIYIFGGAIADDRIPVPIESNELWKFDISSSTFTQIKPFDAWPGTRASATLTFHKSSNSLYLFGGITERAGWLDELWKFDIASSTWTEVVGEAGSIKPCGRSMHAMASVVIGGAEQLMLFGGFGPDVSETNEDDWEDAEEADLKAAKEQQEALSLTRFNDTYLYNPDICAWVYLSPERSPSRRAACRLAATPTDVYLVGGKGDASRLGDVWRFDLKSLTWSENPVLDKLSPRSFHEVAAGDGRVFVHGGRDEFHEHLGEIQQVVPEYECLNCDLAVGNHMFFHYKDDRFYVFGGSSNFDASMGYCTKFHSTLHTGTFSSKKPKLT